MNILFITLLDIRDINERNIYTDLLREFIKNKNTVYLLSPTERRNKERTHVIKMPGCVILKPKIGNVQKTNPIEKGISTLLLEHTVKKSIKKHFRDVRFDAVIYSTPPITFCSVIEFIKKRDGAMSYLLLKDIFPQNGVDLKMFSKSGLLYKYFRSKEKRLYRISDFIGCMSEANKKYIIENNGYLDPERVEVCPNAIEAEDKTYSKEEKTEIRRKYGLPEDKLVFVYGGNLGKPQGADFIISALKTQEKNERSFFLIVGSGTEYGKLENFVKTSGQKNVKLMKSLPKSEYDELAASCDAGMIFLDYCFTIPNFPSRLLSYLQARLPVLVCTDTVCDMGKTAEQNGFGIYCPSNDARAFAAAVEKLVSADICEMGRAGYEYLLDNYSAKRGYDIISAHF